MRNATHHIFFRYADDEYVGDMCIIVGTGSGC